MPSRRRKADSSISVSCAPPRSSPESARAGQRRVGGDDGALELLADAAEAPAVVVQHRAFGQAVELGEVARCQLRQLAGHAGADGFGGAGEKMLPGEGRAQLAQGAPGFRGNRVLDALGVIHGPAQDVDQRTGFGGFQHEAVAVARRGDAPARGGVQVRQQLVPHRPVEPALGGVQLLGFEGLDGLEQIRQMNRALAVTAHPIK